MMPLVSDSLGAVSFNARALRCRKRVWLLAAVKCSGARGEGGVCRGRERARGLGGQGRVATLLFFGSVKQRKFLDARVVKGKSGQAFERGSRRLQWGAPL